MIFIYSRSPFATVKFSRVLKSVVISRLLFCRPIPDREFVETYVKAFYLTENEMERWMREHKVPCLSCLGGAENHINQNKIWHSLTKLLFLMKTFLSRPVSERTVSKKKLQNRNIVPPPRKLRNHLTALFISFTSVQA